MVKEDASHQSGANGYSHIYLQQQASPNYYHSIGTVFNTVNDQSNNVWINVAKANGSLHLAAVFTAGATQYIYGNLTATGNVTANSDQSIKDNIKDIDLTPIFDNCNVKSYNRTDKPELGERVGFIAQDIQKACNDNHLPYTFEMIYIKKMIQHY